MQGTEYKALKRVDTMPTESRYFFVCVQWISVILRNNDNETEYIYGVC